MPSLLFVGAHPDDDIFGVARAVALHVDDPTLRFSLIHATDGEAGEIAPDSGVTRDELGVARRRETREAWKAVGRLPDRHEWFGLPDGRLAEHPFDDLVDRIAAILDEDRPDVVVTFGSDGITGHPDHIAVGEATTTAFHQLVGTGAGLRRLLYCAIPLSWVNRWNEKRLAQGLDPWDADILFHLRGVPDASIGIDVDTAAVVNAVLAGVRAHKTQWSYQAMDSDPALVDSLRRDHYVIAWPATSDGHPPLTDVFEGL
ncbi:MAG TPA: PIG-L family deacetylase [Acidimicrobiia bacterium]|nr:PIG-L family deacetylase [Acidimicrobiia bacterium]